MQQHDQHPTPPPVSHKRKCRTCSEQTSLSGTVDSKEINKCLSTIFFSLEKKININLSMQEKEDILQRDVPSLPPLYVIQGSSAA